MKSASKRISIGGRYFEYKKIYLWPNSQTLTSILTTLGLFLSFLVFYASSSILFLRISTWNQIESIFMAHTYTYIFLKLLKCQDRFENLCWKLYISIKKKRWFWYIHRKKFVVCFMMSTNFQVPNILETLTKMQKTIIFTIFCNFWPRYSTIEFLKKIIVDEY